MYFCWTGIKAANNFWQNGCPEELKVSAFGIFVVQKAVSVWILSTKMSFFVQTIKSQYSFPVQNNWH
jgi:hypothetical protein